MQTHILPVSQFCPSPGRGKTGPTHTPRTRRQSCSRQARAEPDSEDAHSGRAGMIPPWLTPSVVAEGQSECICSVPQSFLSLWNSWLASLSSSTLSASVNMMKSSGKLPDSPVTLNSSRPKSCSAEKVSFAYLLNNSVWVKPGAVWSWRWKCQVCGPPGVLMWGLKRFNDLRSWHKSLEMSQFELRVFKCHYPSVKPWDLLSTTKQVN